MLTNRDIIRNFKLIKELCESYVQLLLDLCRYIVCVVCVVCAFVRVCWCVLIDYSIHSIDRQINMCARSGVYVVCECVCVCVSSCVICELRLGTRPQAKLYMYAGSSPIHLAPDPTNCDNDAGTNFIQSRLCFLLCLVYSHGIYQAHAHGIIYAAHFRLIFGSFLLCLCLV